MLFRSKKICIVDDDSFYAEILSNLLSMQDYEPKHYTSADECLSALAGTTEPAPYAAFILDVVMPGMDGYTLCEKLRQQPRFSKSPVLFVSSKNTLEDRMRGHEVGGNDYLGKPVKPDELKLKLDLAIRVAEQKKAPSAAPRTTPMNESSAVARVVSFMEASVKAKNNSELADAILALLTQLDLSGSILFRCEDAPLFRSSDGSEHAIERELLELAARDRPVIEFNGRLIVTQPLVSVLIRRLPNATPSEIDLIKDQLDAAIRMADQRLADMAKVRQEHRQKKYWLDLLVATEKGVDIAIADKFYSQNVVAEILEEFLISLNESLLDQALDKDQEARLKTIFRAQVDKVAGQLKQHDESMLQAQKPFQELINKLGQSL